LESSDVTKKEILCDVTKKEILCDVIKKDLLSDEGYKSMSSNSSASVVSTTTSISPEVRDPPDSQPSLFLHHNDRSEFLSEEHKIEFVIKGPLDKQLKAAVVGLKLHPKCSIDMQ
jgi:hypothetical protein